MESENNIAYINGQNLFLGTKKSAIPWKIHLARFRIYLQEKYNVSKAYYYLGYIQNHNQHVYEDIQQSGFILVFRQHTPAMIGLKKGNVDSDIILDIMIRVCRKEEFDGIVLISGDGDYKGLVDFLIEEQRFKKILFPDQKRASSLYRQINLKHRADLSGASMRKKIGK